MDTGGDTSCISQEYLTIYFPYVNVKPDKRRLQGIGPAAVYTSGMVLLDILMWALDGTHFLMPVDVLLLDSLGCSLLLGMDTCLPNAFKIDFENNCIWMRVGYSFEVCLEKKGGMTLPWSLKKWGIYAVESTIIQPVHGAGVCIHHLQMDDEGGMLWQTLPVPQVNIEHHGFGSILGAVITSVMCILPYANLGDSPIQLRQGQLLGYIKALAELSYINTTVNFIGTADTENLDEVPISSTVLDIGGADPLVALEADISDEWGPEYWARVNHILDKHWQLFCTELGMFNDNIEMLIPFQDDTDCHGAAVGRLGRLHDYPFWMFSFLCLD